MKSKAKHLLTQVLKIALAVGLIYWLQSSGKIDFAALKNFLNPQWALLGLTIVIVNIFFCSERWRLLLKVQDRPTSSWKAFKLSLMGIFFNYAMPGGVGGDVVKAFYFHKEYPNSKVIAVTSVLIDRILGLYSMMLLGLIIMIYDWSHVATVPVLQSMAWGVALLTLVASIGLHFLFSKKLYQSHLVHRLIAKLPASARLQKFYDSFHSYGRSYSVIGQVILISWGAQLISVFFLILAGELSGGGIPWLTYFLVAPLGYIATGLPITPAGVGIGQAAFYYLFNIYTGQTTNIGSNVITAFQVAQFVIGLAGAYFYIRRGQPVPEDLDMETNGPTDNEYAPSR